MLSYKNKRIGVFLLAAFLIACLGIPQLNLLHKNSSGKSVQTDNYLPYDLILNDVASIQCVNNLGKEVDVTMTFYDIHETGSAMTYTIPAFQQQLVNFVSLPFTPTNGQVIISSNDIENIRCSIRNTDKNKKGQIKLRYSLSQNDIVSGEAYITVPVKDATKEKLYLYNLSDKDDMRLTIYGYTPRGVLKYQKNIIRLAAGDRLELKLKQKVKRIYHIVPEGSNNYVAYIQAKHSSKFRIYKAQKASDEDNIVSIYSASEASYGAEDK